VITRAHTDGRKQAQPQNRMPLAANHHHHHHEISSVLITIRPWVHYNVNVDELNESLQAKNYYWK